MATIRKATVEDFERILNLIKEFSIFISTPEKVSITLEQMVQNRNYFQCMVAIHENKIVGFATYFFAYYSWVGKSAYLEIYT